MPHRGETAPGGRAQRGNPCPAESTLNSEEGDPNSIPHRGKESTLCPAKETLRSHGVDTVAWVREAAFLVVRVPPKGSELTWELCALVTKF